MDIDSNVLRILTALIKTDTIKYYHVESKYVDVFCPGASFRITKRNGDKNIIKEESPKDSEEFIK